MSELSEWISVKDMVPDDGWVIGAWQNSAGTWTEAACWYSYDRHWKNARDEWFAVNTRYGDIRVTHWMPFPEPPQ